MEKVEADIQAMQVVIEKLTSEAGGDTSSGFHLFLD